MAYCYRCGVELEEGSLKCPLCSTAVPIMPTETPRAGTVSGKSYPDFILDPEHGNDPAEGKRRRVALEMVSLTFLLGAIASVTADLLIHSRPNWSLYTLASIGLVWMMLCSLLGFGRHIRVALLSIPVSTSLYLVALDWIDGSISWSLTLAIPIILSLLLTSGIVLLFVKLTVRKGFNIVAYVCMGLVAECFSIEAIIDLNGAGSLSPSWSIIVGLVLVPLSVMSLYIHGHLLHGTDLHKVFRL